MIFPERVLGSSAREDDILRSRDCSDLVRHVLAQLRCQSLRRLNTLLDRDERGDRHSLDVVGPTDDGSLRDSMVVDQGALDLHRPDAMTSHVEDVVNAT